MLTITNTVASTPSIEHASNLLHALERYNGKIYLAQIGRFMLLMKSGSEEIFEHTRLVKPVTNAADAAKMGFVAGAEKALWAHYRTTFGKKAELEGFWNTEAVVERGGIQVNDDFDVFMYPRVCATMIDGVQTVVHGEHCAIRFNGTKVERLESTMYEPYREGEAKFYNEKFSRVLNDKEMQGDAKYQAEHKPYFAASNGDRLHVLREWLDDVWNNGGGEGEEYEMLETLESKAMRLFGEAKRARTHIDKCKARVKNAPERSRKMMGRDLIDLDINARALYSEAMIMRQLASHLENLIVDRLNGGFEEQNFEFGGQVREVSNHWLDMFAERDMSYTERLHADTDLRIQLSR